MSHLNTAFDRFASIGTVMHYILVISFRSAIFGTTFGIFDLCPRPWWCAVEFLHAPIPHK